MADAISIPIKVWQVLGGSGIEPQIRRIAEKATQTFKIGTPVNLDSNGFVQEEPTLSSALKVAGIAHEPASNLSSDGVPKTLTYASVQGQANALLIPGGATPNLGDCGILIADDKTVFVGKVDDAHTTSLADVGVIYGLTKATNGQWYVDTTVIAAASGAVTEVVATVGDLKAGGLVAFRFTKAAQLF